MKKPFIYGVSVEGELFTDRESEMFYSRSMPFFQFGDLFFLPKIAEEKWADFIVKRFSTAGKAISPDLALTIARRAQCHSAYVQQIAWNVMVETSSDTVTAADCEAGFRATLAQVTPLFAFWFAETMM